MFFFRNFFRDNTNCLMFEYRNRSFEHRISYMEVKNSKPKLHSTFLTFSIINNNKTNIINEVNSGHKKNVIRISYLLLLLLRLKGLSRPSHVTTIRPIFPIHCSFFPIRASTFTSRITFHILFDEAFSSCFCSSRSSFSHKDFLLPLLLLNNFDSSGHAKSAEVFALSSHQSWFYCGTTNRALHFFSFSILHRHYS